MILREAISQVKSLFKNVNADSRMTNKFVYSILKKHSKWLIFRDSEKLKLLKKHRIYQKIKCLKVIEAPSVDPCCGLRVLNCNIFRTEIKLPELYEDSFGVIIKNITSVDGWTDIVLTTASNIKRMLNNPWKGLSPKKIYCFFHDGYLYFPKEHLKMIEVEGLYVHTVDSTKNCDPCKDCDKKPCPKFLDGELIIPDYLESQVFEATLKDISNTYLQIQEGAHEINKNSNLSS